MCICRCLLRCPLQSLSHAQVRKFDGDIPTVLSLEVYAPKDTAAPDRPSGAWWFKPGRRRFHLIPSSCMKVNTGADARDRDTLIEMEGGLLVYALFIWAAWLGGQ